MTKRSSEILVKRDIFGGKCPRKTLSWTFLTCSSEKRGMLHRLRGMDAPEDSDGNDNGDDVIGVIQQW